MIPGQFEYARPASVAEALRLLKDREGEAKVLSGGYSLLPLLKLRLAQPGLLVDIRDLDGLDAIVETEGELRIGARVTHASLENSLLVHARYPLIADAAKGIADRQVRNWGTVGGSLAHADPSSDWPAVFIALGASIVCRSLAGERIVPARQWCLGVFQTAIEPSELLTEVRIPHPGPRSGGAYQKLERRAGDFATVGVAVQVRLDGEQRIVWAGVGLTAVSDAPFAATTAEAVLVGNEPSEDLYRRAAAAAAAQAEPTADGHGPVEYKRAMTAEMTVRALRLAVERASQR